MLQNPHVQSTIRQWPNSQSLKESLSLPLVLSLSPFANDHPLSSINSDRISQYRCQSCKAFFNQLCFIRSQNEYDCSLCGCTNYLRTKIDLSMCELNNLSYRLKAPNIQRSLGTKDRLAIFILDLSFYGLDSKQYLLFSVKIIKQFVRKLKESNTSMNILLLGFDTSIHRFCLNSPNGPSWHKTHGLQEEGDDIYQPKPELIIGNSIDHFDNIMITLDEIENTIQNQELIEAQSESIIEALKIGLRLGREYSGKLFLVSGIRKSVPEFERKMNKYFYDNAQKHSYVTNKTQCLKGQLQKILNSTHISISFFIITNKYINNICFHIISKQTNGELRQFFSHQKLVFFETFEKSVQSLLDESTAYQSLLKVRYSTGLKLIGLFGPFKTTKITDQIDLLTCPSNRKYLFEFIIEGKVTASFVIVQFSSLYTDWKGDRYFIIETHSIKVTDCPSVIIKSIDYLLINESYVRGVIHNLDGSGNIRNLLLTLQQRCRKHINFLRKSSLLQTNFEKQEEQCDNYLQKVRPYTILTFLMMKHFLLNQNYKDLLHFDLNIEARSKICTQQYSINIIWPLVYTLNEEGWQIAQLQDQYISKATTAIFIDRGDQYYCYLIDPKHQAQVRTANGRQILMELMQKQEKLQSLRNLTDEIRRGKQRKYIDILPIDDLRELKILDKNGAFGFDRFISVLCQE